MVFLPQPPGQFSIPTIPAIQFQSIAQFHRPIEPTFCPLATIPEFRPASLQLLDFEQLQSFDLVQHQYQTSGIEFEDAIALRPSNPVFFNSAYSIGLVPLIDRKPLTIHFHKLAKFISVNLQGTKRMTIRAYNHDLIEEQQIDFAQISNNRIHIIQQPAIAKVEIQANTPFLLYHLIFG